MHAVRGMCLEIWEDYVPRTGWPTTNERVRHAILRHSPGLDHQHHNRRTGYRAQGRFVGGGSSSQCIWMVDPKLWSCSSPLPVFLAAQPLPTESSIDSYCLLSRFIQYSYYIYYINFTITVYLQLYHREEFSCRNSLTSTDSHKAEETYPRIVGAICIWLQRCIAAIQLKLRTDNLYSVLSSN